MLSNFDLEKLAGFYKLPLVGIFMKNELPKKLIDGCYIINLQSSTQGNGTHWTSMVVWKKMSYYFDSFGAPPPVEIINFTKKKKGGHLLYNNWIIQDIKSENCGWYSLAFLLHMWKNRQNIKMKDIFNQFVNNFMDDTLRNDEILKMFFSKTYGVSVPIVLKKFIE
jgi:hypothetical protein